MNLHSRGSQNFVHCTSIPCLSHIARATRRGEPPTTLESNMKTLLATAALAAVIAAPALAQTVDRRPVGQQQFTQYDQYGRTEVQRRAINPDSNSVYEGNAYLGADPDPNIRLNLRMDYEHRDF